MQANQAAVPGPARGGRRVELPGFTLHIGAHAPGSELVRHAHDEPTICYVVRGRFTEYSGGRAVDCGGGTLKVMPAGEPHSNRFAQVTTRGIRIDVDRGRLAQSPRIARALDERMHFERGRAADLARRIVRVTAHDDEASRLTAEGLVLELLAELAPAEPVPHRGAPPTWARRADDLIRARMPELPSLDELALEVGVRPATLARGYRASFGCTIGERVRELRVEAAARALACPEPSLAEIAVQAGFYDQSHFTNVFRRLRGMTPAEYRRQAGARS